MRADVAQPSVSALMSTYAKDRPEWLVEALESVFAQSLVPGQLVLVVDGPVGAELDAVIGRYATDPRIPRVDVLRLPQNCGLAAALNAGLELCTGEWMMRMDSDDVCMPRRLELQVEHLRSHPETDVVSSWCEEFFDGKEGTRLKASPVTHDALVQALRWRNVLVHPTILVRTETLRRVDGYRTRFGKLEDYDLFVRLAMEKARFHVIPAALVRVRASLAQSARRGGLGYCMREIAFRAFCLRKGFLNLDQFVVITSAYVAFRLAGPVLRGRLYSLARA